VAWEGYFGRKGNSKRLWLCHILVFGAYGENEIEESSRELIILGKIKRSCL